MFISCIFSLPLTVGCTHSLPPTQEFNAAFWKRDCVYSSKRVEARKENGGKGMGLDCGMKSKMKSKMKIRIKKFVLSLSVIMQPKGLTAY